MSLNTREFRAEAKFQRVSPQKARLVLDLIKGLRVEEALQTVAFTKKGIAPVVEKVLRSAIQNANYLSDERGLDIDVDNLFVKSAIANDGPRLKRIRPAPMGRAFRYQRRTSHIMIMVAERRVPEGVDVDATETAAPAKKKGVIARAQDRAAAAKKAASKTSAKKTAAKTASTKTAGKKASAKKTPKAGE